MWSKFVSLELDDEDKLDMACPIPMPDRPRFPYEMRIALTQQILDKLEMNLDGCTVGAVIDLRCLAKVTSVSENEMEDADGKPKKNCRVELQIEQLALENENSEETPQPPRKAFRDVAYSREKE